MLVGMTDRGWGSIGARRDGLQRVVWKKVVPFEILNMRVTPRGFRLKFTRPLDRATASAVSSYSVESYNYDHHQEYGCPERRTAPHEVKEIRVLGADEVEIVLDRMRIGYVHELHAEGVRAASGEALLHAQAYYTLQRLPRSEK